MARKTNKPTSKPATPSPDNRALVPPRMTILSDHPILRPKGEDARREHDAFTLHSRLGAVYDIIRHRNTRAPIAVAVYGDWGTGKSSAMRWLGEQLAQWSDQSKEKRGGHFRARTVWFDPWKYTKREDVWRGLITEVIIEAIQVRGASLKTVVSAARKFGLFLGRSFLNILASTELTVGVKEAGVEAKVDLDALAKIAEDYRQTAHPEKAFLNEFETALREWVKTSLADDERMVIFIDDLDRCLPEVVLEVLEALKLYLNIPQLIFVVGLDREVVEAVVKQHYKAHGLGEAKAERYLDKMFQVEVDIPPSQRQMGDFLTGQIQALDRAADGYWSKCLTEWEEGYRKIIEDRIAELAESNPREIKRLLNSTLVSGTAAGRHDAIPGSEEQRFTQGCQVYLIQRVLRKFVPDSAALLRDNKALAFFDRWSGFIQLHPGFRPGSDRESSEEIPADEQRASRKGPASPADDEATKAFEELRAGLPRYTDTGEPYPLLDQPQLWDLLRIPFSADVAAAATVASDDDDSQPADAPPAPAVQAEPPAAPTTREAAPPRPAAPPKTSLQDMPRSLRSAIARALDKPVEKLRSEDLPNVTELDLSNTELTDVSPLAGLTGLQTLWLHNTQVSDLSPLAGLSGLQTLYLGNTQVSDLSPLARLTGLQTLYLNYTQVSDVSPLAGLTGLQRLRLDFTPVSDVSPLAGLTGLRKLDLDNTQVLDVSPLAGLTGLQLLYVDEGVDTGPVAGIEGLQIVPI